MSGGDDVVTDAVGWGTSVMVFRTRGEGGLFGTRPSPRSHCGRALSARGGAVASGPPTRLPSGPNGEGRRKCIHGGPTV